MNPIPENAHREDNEIITTQQSIRMLKNYKFKEKDTSLKIITSLKKDTSLKKIQV